MKATTALPAPALSYKPRVKKFLIRGIIYLTSDKFSIFVVVIAALFCWVGVCIENCHLIGYGAIAFLIGSVPWSIRQALRDMSREKSAPYITRR